MIRFTRLRLQGFKSFVEPADVPIEPGLTGVVGPNGCGKSNLVEALRWVMGENSSRGMRASGMDDVIFSGSGKRPSRNIAEVSVKLDNADRSAPAAFNSLDEIEVVRRIERGTGSDYRINGKLARARDVQMLFADSSTGARSPAMVRQGQIGDLVNAKPAARRQVLEEAAGISGLHARRHEAELRLKATAQNLERVEDVIAEVGRQVGDLSKQARQARRYRTLSAEIRKTSAALWFVRWRAAREASEAAAEALATARARVSEAAEAQTAAAREEAVAGHALPGLREAEQAASAELQRLEAARRQAEGEERRVADRLATLERQRADVERDIAREGTVRADAEAALAALAEEASELDRQLQGADERLEGLRAAVAEAEAALAEAEPAAADAIAAEAAARSEAKAARDTLARAEAADRKARADLAAREDARARAGGTDAAEAARAAARARLDEAEAAEAAAEEAVAAAEAAVAEARRAERTAEADVQAIDRESAELAAEAKAIERLLGTGEATGGTGNAGGKGNTGKAGPGKDRKAGKATDWPDDDAARRPGAVDAIEVAPGYEVALAAALGEDLDAPIAADAPLGWWPEPAAAADDPALPAGLAPLAAHVKAPPALARRLAQVGVAEAAEAARLAATLGPGQRLVTREGASFRWDGLYAVAGAPSAAARRLESRNRLKELRGLIEALAARRAAAADAHARAKAGLEDAQRAERGARDSLKRARGEVEEARAALAKAERAVEAALIEARAAETALEEARSRAAETAAALEAARRAAADAPDPEACAAAAASARETLAERREAAAARRADYDAQVRQTEGRRRRRAKIDEERAGWTRRLDGTAGHGEELAARARALAEEHEALSAAPAEIAGRKRRLLSDVQAAKAALGAAAKARESGESAHAAAQNAARRAVETLSESREAAARAEERASALAARAQEIATEIGERFETAPAALPGIAELAEDAPLPDEETTRTRLERLTAERERLGGVNLRAEEELAELEARRDSLVAERDDLAAAIDKLRSGLAAINKEARQRLLAAFETVDGHFRRLFTHLFGGGEARLKLVEADDPLEAGLDIEARPPGKKPQSLSLLSGGEQALTATAMIFAVFLTNPAPICVLDEVDAPLDDANVNRFCALLDEMTRLTDTRFLVITHNPITMAHMHRLYGVTMVERGVSQLVSVSLETAERLREAG